MIVGLDGLRAIAFLGVLAYHTNILRFGWMGVQLFFVLSGFLITNILLRMKETLKRGDFFKKFYGRRALRILPLYYLYLLALTLLVVILPNINLEPLVKDYSRDFHQNIWASVFYVSDFFFASASYIKTWQFTHLWSLSVEEQFYLVWPLLIFLTPQKYFKKLCLVAIALGPAFRLITTLIYRQHLFPFLLNDPQQATYVLPFSHIDAFAMGAFISRFDIPRPRLQLLGMIILVPALGLLTDYLVTGQALISTLGYKLPLAGAFKEVWGYSLLNYTFALMIYCVVRTKLLVSDLNASILRYLGRISYGLYVYHFFTIALVMAVLRKLGIDRPLGSPEIFWYSLIATVAIASLSYYLVEKPILNLKTKHFRLTTDSTAPEPSDQNTQAFAEQ